MILHLPQPSSSLDHLRSRTEDFNRKPPLHLRPAIPSTSIFVRVRRDSHHTFDRERFDLRRATITNKKSASAFDRRSPSLTARIATAFDPIDRDHSPIALRHRLRSTIAERSYPYQSLLQITEREPPTKSRSCDLHQAVVYSRANKSKPPSTSTEPGELPTVLSAA